MLIAYVDDFKCSGPADAVDRLFVKMRSPGATTPAIEMDDPTEPGKFLGCMHRHSTKTSPITGKPVKTIEYDMEEFFSSCVDRYCELAGVQRSKLKKRHTPFVTDCLEGARTFVLGCALNVVESARRQKTLSTAVIMLTVATTHLW